MAASNCAAASPSPGAPSYQEAAWLKNRDPCPVRMRTASPGVQPGIGQSLRGDASLEVIRADLYPRRERTALEALHVQQDAPRKKRRRLLDAEFLQPVRRPALFEVVAIVEQRLAQAAGAARMAQRVHMGADLADFGRQKIVVPNGSASPTLRPPCAAARHAQFKTPTRRERHSLGVRKSQLHDLSSPDEPSRGKRLLLGEKIAGALLVARFPRARETNRRREPDLLPVLSRNFPELSAWRPHAFG